MISFRYHLVSIVAVFLALALGIVVGTTGLNGEILKGLKSEVKSLRADNGTLRTTNAALSKQANDDSSYVGAYEKQVVAGSLTGKPVLIVSAPGVPDSMKSGVENAVKAAGGIVAGRIDVQSAYLDPGRQNDLRGFATTSASRPAGLQLPETSDAAVLGGALLAYVLSGKGTATNLLEVISGLSRLGMLRVEGSDPTSAALGVVLTAGAVPKNDPRGTGMPALVEQLSSGGVHTVAAGDLASTTLAGLLATLRADSAVTRSVSTVDNADTVLGQVSTVLALGNTAVGQYGTGAGVDRLFPAPK